MSILFGVHREECRGQNRLHIGRNQQRPERQAIILSAIQLRVSAPIIINIAKFCKFKLINIFLL